MRNLVGKNRYINSWIVEVLYIVQFKDCLKKKSQLNFLNQCMVQLPLVKHGITNIEIQMNFMY